MIGIVAVYNRECVESNFGSFQVLNATHHAVKRWLLAFIHAIEIVQISRPVNRNADEEIICCEELGPGCIEGHAIGLDCVLDALSLRVFFLQRQDILEPRDAEQRWLSLLQRETDERLPVR